MLGELTITFRCPASRALDWMDAPQAWLRVRSVTPGSTADRFTASCQSQIHQKPRSRSLGCPMALKAVGRVAGQSSPLLSLKRRAQSTLQHELRQAPFVREPALLLVKGPVLERPL